MTFTFKALSAGLSTHESVSNKSYMRIAGNPHKRFSSTPKKLALCLTLLRQGITPLIKCAPPSVKSNREAITFFVGSNLISRALLVIDMLNDFVHGSLKVPAAKDIIPNIKRLIDVFRSRKLPVIYVNDDHIRNVDLELRLWGQHAITGTWGSKVIDELEPQEGDFIISKRRYSGFFATDLDLLLRELNVKSLVLTGVVTDICVLHTAADAFFRGYEVIVVSDATASLTHDRHERALSYMKEVYGAKILSTTEVENMLLRPQP